MRYKKTLQLFTCAALLAMCSACSGNAGKPAASEKPLDLSGSWKEENATAANTYQIAYVSGDEIEIYWVMENETQAGLYWSGTYTAPADSKTPYTWTSNNNTDKTSNSIYASPDPTKEFTFSEDKISYEVSVMGVTKTEVLVRTDLDYSSIGKPTDNAVSAEQIEKVQLVDSGYSVITNSYDNSKYINYAVQITNPNESYAIQFPEIHITAKGTDGSILSTDSQTLYFIAAGDTYYYAGMTRSYQGDMPGSVEITVDNSDNNAISQQGSDIVLSRDLAVSNTSDTADSTTGEITNNSTVDLSTAAVIVVFKKGDQLVGGDETYINNLNSGSTAAFQISKYMGVSAGQYDSYTVNVLQWGF